MYEYPEIKQEMQRNPVIVPIVLDSSIAIKMSMGGSMFQEKALMNRADVWHKFKIVRGVMYDKEVVLKAILAAIEPADLIPVKYQHSGEDTFFLARNCAVALEKLCKSNLIIKNTYGDPLILVITLGYALIHDLKINIQPLLVSALSNKFDMCRMYLNLEEFHMDPEIAKVVYCPLSQQRTLNHVLKLAKNQFNVVEHLNLQGNGLFNLSPLEISSLCGIKYLDLRHNNLMNMECLSPLKNLPILKLWLDGNPLCENYFNVNQYIESAKNYCPNLVQLDGVFINSTSMPYVFPEYYKDEMSRRLARKFVTHFFNLYDQSDKMLLKGLYLKNAIFSFSLGITNAAAHKRNLVQFTANRNLLRTKDLVKRDQHIHFGQEDILAALKKLPRCFHDRDSFTIDVMHDDEKCLVICVGGIVKKLNPDGQVLAFNRTFVLLAGPDSEYNILNDQYHVDTACEKISPESISTKIIYDDFVPTCFSTTEKREIWIHFKNVTALNDEWTHTYLEETCWDLRKAIANFMKDLKSSAVPPDAFRK